MKILHGGRSSKVTVSRPRSPGAQRKLMSSGIWVCAGNMVTMNTVPRSRDHRLQAKMKFAVRRPGKTHI